MSGMTVPVVGRCVAPGCGAEMIPQKVWLRKTELRTYRRSAGHGLCDMCYARARRAGTLPHPAPPKPVAAPDIDVEPRYTIRCEECGVVETTGNRAYANDVRRQHRAEHSDPEVLASMGQ